jgi:hypothetical protein
VRQVVCGGRRVVLHCCRQRTGTGQREVANRRPREVREQEEAVVRVEGEGRAAEQADDVSPSRGHGSWVHGGRGATVAVR